MVQGAEPLGAGALPGDRRGRRQPQQLRRAGDRDGRAAPPRPAPGRSSTSSTRRTRSACATRPSTGPTRSAPTTQYEAFKLSDQLDYDDYGEVADACRELGIVFFATPFDLPPSTRSRRWARPLYKIASADITHRPLLEAVAATGKPVLLSTGAATLDEIRRGDRLDWASGPTSSCCSPARSPTRRRTRTATSRASPSFRREFAPYLIGMSDHTLGVGRRVDDGRARRRLHREALHDRQGAARRPRPRDERRPARAGRDGPAPATGPRVLRGEPLDRRARVRAARARQRPPLDRARARRRAGQRSRPTTSASSGPAPGSRPETWAACLSGVRPDRFPRDTMLSLDDLEP